jgi:hypothetical protein
VIPETKELNLSLLLRESNREAVNGSFFDFNNFPSLNPGSNNKDKKDKICFFCCPLSAGVLINLLLVEAKRRRKSCCIFEPQTQQLFRRLFASTSKRFIKTPADSGQQKKQILSFLSLLLDPGFNEGKLLKSKKDPLTASLLDSLNNNDKLSSFVSGITSNKVLYPSISAQVLSNYIKKQMSAPQKLKDLDFRINLKTGISLLALFLLKRSPLGSSIRGLRVVCSGR